MSWVPKHTGEVLVSTLTGQPSVLSSSSGVVQVPLDASVYGIPVPTGFGTVYRGIRVVLEFTLTISNSAAGWFGYVYLGDRAYDPTQVGHLSGNLSYQFVSGVSQAGSPYSGVLDFEFDCATFPPDQAYAVWNGRGTRTLTGIADGTAQNGSLGQAKLKSILDSAFVQVYMGQGGTADLYPIQVTRVYVSEYPTADTPVAPNAPSIYPASGTLQGVQLVVIQGSGTIRYTLGGSEPTASSPIYTGPFRLASSATVKAKAFQNSLSSDTTTSVLVIQGADYLKIPSYTAAVLPYLLEQYKGDNP